MQRTVPVTEGKRQEKISSGILKRLSRSLLALIWAAFVAAALLLGSKWDLLPEAPDAWTYDWRTALLSETAPKPRDDIAIVLIGEESLDQYIWRSPVNRRLLANLVAALDRAGAKAIGLDFIFDRTQGEDVDEELQTALRNTRAPVILGVIDRRTQRASRAHLEFQERFVKRTGRPAGHLYFGHQPGSFTIGDHVIRYRPEASQDGTPRQSFSLLLAEADGERPQILSRLISWLQPLAEGGAQVFPTISVEPHAPGAQADALLPPGWESVVKDRIVLVGGDFIDRDGHLTPFSVLDGKRTPGVMIHAQMVAQIRDQRSVEQMPFEHEAIALVLIAIFGGVLSTVFHLRTDSLSLWLVGVTGIVVVGLISFGTLRLIIPSSTLFLAWMGGIWGHQVITYVENKLSG